ncbi:class A beta-lactamase-related serine hydrolase [Flavobacterium arcticum]|uniref:Class A beta-lactamase-related serine hydrolase n=1 Tax=Flavobacterium arcticum TaxID=1784713 RepID=A0A345HAK1_9FLAO|nr:serine hydrolase domain-containing protein [Flavobacterium arcticum]AXG73611.1 class A beta-lactamase-related serine hydrolase [Flavobacterium arcticum]KAF2506410.1 beta-lactamase family protein [Flavobacterium arcticum]
MKKISQIFLITLFLTLSVGVKAQSVEMKFQQVLDSVYTANKDAVGIMIHVEAPDKNISWTSAVGYANKETQEAINKNQPAIIASNTKTYVAVAIVKLIENGKLQLNQPIADLINPKTKELLIADGYKVNQITIKHLLSHTSGIADYVNDAYFAFIFEHQDYHWTRDEQIQFAVENANPLAEAGKTYSYADTNYLLLTEIIEHKTKKPFYTAIRELLEFKKHQLNATWFYSLEKYPKNVLPLVHQYYSKYGLKVADLHPSFDLYGGGGLTATTKDLAMFFQLLFEGKIVKDKKLLEQMHTYVLPQEESRYCLGLQNINFHGMHAYYHGGFWGTDCMYVPELNTTISVYTLEKSKRELNAEISNTILQIIKQ